MPSATKMIETLPASATKTKPGSANARSAAVEAPARSLWVSWERHRRTREISRDLSIPLLEIVTGSPPILRYPVLFVRTAAALARHRPTWLFVQCPSIFLAMWVLVLKPIFRFRVAVDLHNEAVEPFINQMAWYRALLRWIHRRADFGIVTNEPLARIVRAHGGQTFVLPDKVPVFKVPKRSARTTGDLVVFVCTYAPDEPYTAVIEAARLLGPAVTVRITGKPGRAVLPSLPSNVTLTGYLSEATYLELLHDADVIVDLTAMDNCLVCGAYEAAALGKPLVTSDTAALRAYFSSGTVYTQHDPESLAEAIARALQEKRELARDMTRLGTQLTRAWNEQRDVLAARLARGEVR